MPTSRPVQTQGKLGDILSWYSDIEELKDEVEEWRDSIPENLQSSDKYSQIDELVDKLGNAARELEDSCNRIETILEEIPKGPGGVSVLNTLIRYTEHKMYKGYPTPRWVRLANPCAALGAAMQFIEDYIEEHGESLSKDYVDELQSIVESVNNTLEDIEGVEFPTMFG